jgi:exosortase/archaeosortase family protein
MKKFLLTYWLGILLLFAFFYWEQSPFSEVINNIQTSLTALITSFSLKEGMMQGHRIIITEHYALVIEKACNGMIPYLFFLASIIAFPSTLTHKLKWAIMGYLFISSINIFRIWFVTQFTMHEQSNFSLAHDFLGNVLLILTGLILFTSFIKTRHPKKTTKSIVPPKLKTLPITA